MSMIGQFRMLSPLALARIGADSRLVRGVLAFDPKGAAHQDAPFPMPDTVRSVLDAMPDTAREQLLDGMREQFASVTRQIELTGHGHLLGGLVSSDDERSRALVEAGLGPIDLPAALDVEKAWHGLHFLLAGTAAESDTVAGKAVLGGQPVGEDLGYGPARVLAPAEVRAVSAALDAIAPDELSARFDPILMDGFEIYPGGWGDMSEGHRAWLLEAFDALRRYYAAAAAKGFGMMLYLT